MNNTTATPVKDSIMIVGVYAGYERTEISVPCVDYDAFQALPAAVSYSGLELGKTGWNSDKGVAYYSTNRRVAYRK